MQATGLVRRKGLGSRFCLGISRSSSSLVLRGKLVVRSQAGQRSGSVVGTCQCECAMAWSPGSQTSLCALHFGLRAGTC